MKSLGESGLIDETVIWDNSGTLKPIDGVTVVNAEKNYGTYGRRLAAKLCRNKLVYLQDDDYIVHNIDEILASYLEKPDCIAAALSDGHYRVEANRKPYLQLGWGSVQKKEWLINAVKPYIERHGVDDLLLSKFDRIYSVLHAKHNPLRGNFTRLKTGDTDSDRDKSSLWLQKNHWELRRKAVDRAVELRDAVEARPV